MKVLDSETKFAHLGKPGSTFSKGFQRRLDLLLKNLEIDKDSKILDQGCGEGVWLDQFAQIVGYDNVFGFDVDKELIDELLANNKEIKSQNIKICPGEAVDFEDNSFDIVFSNEVLEHVEDDRKSAEEIIRILKPGGKFIIFTPNRGWPFETHGMFFRGRYYWGNIPFLPWMPKSIRNKFSPHVRNYSNRDIKNLFQGLDCKVIHHSHVFPAFDKLSRKWGLLGKFIQKTFHLLEKTPLHFFGISHFIIVEKN